MEEESIFYPATAPLASRALEEARFSVHGLSLRVFSDSGPVLRAVEGLLGYFRRGETPPAGVTFYLVSEAPSRFPFVDAFLREGSVLFDSRRDGENGPPNAANPFLVYRSWEGRFMADFGPRGSLFLDTAAGLGLGFFPDPEAVHPAVLSNYMFLVGFSEMLRTRDLFLIHAAAVAGNGKGVLAPALSGNGKTTLCLSLLHGGFKYLSDDRPILRRTDGGFEILSFPEEIDVTEKTISLFPALRNLDPSCFRQGLRKKGFSVERCWPGATVDRTVPRVLLFPRVVEEDASRLRPLSKTEAVSRLLPHSLLVMDPLVAAKQFHLLCDMAESMDCYELLYGRDVLSVHELIRGLVG
ncbi:MAG TPA: hypothetical protein PLO86_12040 [Syntrophales bacterium]|nr:hypothetical protein [Syntrophales bacterium]